MVDVDQVLATIDSKTAPSEAYSTRESRIILTARSRTSAAAHWMPGASRLREMLQNFTQSAVMF